MSRSNCKERREIRKKFALERQETAKNRTPQEQLERLDEKFGKGKGATKERAKLLSKIEKNKEPEESK